MGIRQTVGDQPGNTPEDLGRGIAALGFSLEAFELGDAPLPDFRLGSERVMQRLGMGEAHRAFIGTAGGSSLRLDAGGPGGNHIG